MRDIILPSLVTALLPLANSELYSTHVVTPTRPAGVLAASSTRVRELTTRGIMVDCGEEGGVDPFFAVVLA
ncbi:hypothetical protein F5B18DRAFT_634365 [Nemania serpens]|nr:hypothetical protein F5B18DRAFT_634365 [Nemania serpens]